MRLDICKSTQVIGCSREQQSWLPLFLKYSGPIVSFPSDPQASKPSSYLLRIKGAEVIVSYSFPSYLR